VASDGVPSIDHLRGLFTRISAMGGLLAAFGVVQFFTHEAWTEYLSIPGLTLNQQLDSVLGRQGFSRPAGTATHPIEFGVVLTMILPIALTCAINLRDGAPIRRWLPVAAIAFAIPLSISRSAIVGAAVGLAVLLPTWPRRIRWAALGSIATLLVVIFLAIPGILGTITGLFTGIGDDSSAQSRVTAYGVAWEFIQRSPIIGRGFSTFLPRYWILDNQYLGLLIEVGVLGLVAAIALLGAGVWAAGSARRLSLNPHLRAAGAALAASVLCGAVGLALYDTLGFAMSAGTLMLMLGLSSASLRLARERAPEYVRHSSAAATRMARNPRPPVAPFQNHPFAADERSFRR
jgi:O-antigen ligase